MSKKKKIHLFFRKPIYGINFSIENWYIELIKKFRNKDFEFKIKICPFESKGVLNRISNIIWAIFNQGDVNHITGDINFISLFLDKKKTINTIHDHYSLNRLKGIKRLIYYLFWVLIPSKKSTYIIANSKKTKKEIIKYTNIDKNKIVITGICVQKNYKKKFKKFNKQKPKILIIGTKKNKNIKSILISVIDINCELIIIGNLDKEDLLILKKYKINYKNYVALSNKEVFNEYVNSDLLLFPSLYEGFGMPILEAQTVGRPVITSNLEPMNDVGGNGAFYVDPHNKKSIRNGLIKVIRNKFLRDKLINNGFKNIKRFNKDKILKKHLYCYYKILNNKISD
jgi:hypothetical protein